MNRQRSTYISKLASVPAIQSLMAAGIVTSLMLGTIAIVAPQAFSGQRSRQVQPDRDNIYHEDENLPDDADIFPRMGKMEGATWEHSNCRATPGGRVVTTFGGNSFVEINQRRVDGKGESWFYTPNAKCWIHNSRIDLL